MKYSDPEAFCIVTGKQGCDLHHIKTRGSGGTDDEWNLIPISRTLHQRWHHRGTQYMVKGYPAIRNWMIKNGWKFDIYSGKWLHP